MSGLTDIYIFVCLSGGSVISPWGGRVPIFQNSVNPKLCQNSQETHWIKFIPYGSRCMHALSKSTTFIWIEIYFVCVWDFANLQLVCDGDM